MNNSSKNGHIQEFFWLFIIVYEYYFSFNLNNFVLKSFPVV